jgi:hypothetical protein
MNLYDSPVPPSLNDSIRLATWQGFELNFRSLAPQPWPSYRQLSSFKIQQPLAEPW